MGILALFTSAELLILNTVTALSNSHVEILMPKVMA